MKEFLLTDLAKLNFFLKRDQNIQLAILFGSYARGTQTANSDLDLAIQLEEPMTSKQKLAYLEKLYEITCVNTDLVDLHRAGQPLLSQIMKYGQILKKNSRQFAELAVRNVNTSQDFLPCIERLLKERRERLLNG
jgi:uncharacterized protein